VLYNIYYIIYDKVRRRRGTKKIHHAKEKKEAFSISKLCIEMGKAYGASKSMVMKILRTHEENGNIEIAGDTFITTNNGGKK